MFCYNYHWGDFYISWDRHIVCSNVKKGDEYGINKKNELFPIRNTNALDNRSDVVLTDKDFYPPEDNRYLDYKSSEYFDYKKAYDDMCIKEGLWD